MNKRSILLLLLLSFKTLSALGQLSAAELELVAPSLGYADDFSYSIELDLRLLQSTQERLPFWMHHDYRGQLAVGSRVNTYLSGRTATFLTSDSQLFFGGGLNYHDGKDSGVTVSEVYIHYNTSRFYFTAGKKHRPPYYNGLSASNENILWSQNASALPGIQLGIKKRLYPVGSYFVGFEGTWEEYWFENDRYVKETRLHHKVFRLIFQKDDWEVMGGIRHFAQWGGISPKTGQQPNDFENYLKVWSGKEGLAGTGNGAKVIANHLGSYELFFTRKFFNFSLQFFYNSIFDDISGRRMENFPDGRYGIFYSARENDNFVNSVLYEINYTMHQSKASKGFHKYDNYFNNGTYMSGWTYQNRVLGSPFFTLDEESPGIINNRFIAQHLGIDGVIGNYFLHFPYRLLLSYAENHGRYNQKFDQKQEVFYGLFEIQIFQNLLDVHVQTGVEFKSTSSPIFGAGISVQYKI